MQISLSSKRAIVSGSTSGLGYAIAKGLAAAGATVVLNGPIRELVDGALAKLRSEIPDAVAYGIAADLGTAEGTAKLLAAHPDADILVNSLGIYGSGDFFSVPDDEWERFFAVNVLSGVRLARAYLPGMAQRGWGRVIFLSSDAGLIVPPGMIHYAVTKTAYLTLSRGLAKRMAGTGVTVNAILPGPTLSDGLALLLRDEQKRSGKPIEEVAFDFIRATRPSSIIQRPATVEEVANLAVYIASPLSAATTGSALRVDGGVVDSIV